jgi:serine protease
MLKSSRSSSPPPLARVAVAAVLAVGLLPRSASASPLAPALDTASVDPLPESAEVIAGAVAVDLEDDLPTAAVARLEQRYGLHPNSAYSADHDRLELGVVSLDGEAAELDALSHEPGVVHAEPMEVFRASFVPNDPLYADQWHLKRVGAETAWEYGCGRGVTVAVIDTGVACFDKGPFSRGTDLAGTRCEGGYNFVSDSADAYDDQGHGTHVAGTVAQTTNNGRGTAGLAFCAELMPIKVLNRFGWGTLTDVAEGIRFAADHGAQVINLSLGGSSKSGILEDAVRDAQKKGVLIVAAAGNSGKAVGYPAAYDGVLAVSATDTNDTIAWFSSRGPQVGIAAPGVGVTQQTICQAGRNKCELFGTFSGTSMASPHVAGSAALVMGLGLGDASSVRDALTRTARASAAGDNPSLYGAGIVDAAAAIQQVFVRHLFARLGATLVFLWWVWRRIRSRRGSMSLTPGVLFGAMAGGIGALPFLPMLRVLPRLGAWRWLGELAMRPFGEWDAGWSMGVHHWLPLANAIPVGFGMALFFGVKRLRPTLGGFAVGMTALLAQLAFSLDVTMPFGALATRLWLVANAAICLWLARTALEAERAS